MSEQISFLFFGHFDVSKTKEIITLEKYHIYIVAALVTIFILFNSYKKEDYKNYISLSYKFIMLIILIGSSSRMNLFPSDFKSFGSILNSGLVKILIIGGVMVLIENIFKNKTTDIGEEENYGLSRTTELKNQQIGEEPENQHEKYKTNQRNKKDLFSKIGQQPKMMI